MKRRYLLGMTCILASMAMAACSGGETTGTSSQKPNKTKQCTKDCMAEAPTDSGLFVCALIDGQETCVSKCLGNQVGTNQAQCIQASPFPDWYSVVDT